MNKRYIKPISEPVLFNIENMIASSPISAKSENGYGDWNSRRRNSCDDFEDEWEDEEEF